MAGIRFDETMDGYYGDNIRIKYRCNLIKEYLSTQNTEADMKQLLSVLLLLLPLLFISSNATACDDISSRLLARSYILSNPILGDGNQLISLMRSNPGYFNTNGGATKCMQLLGAALIKGGMAQYNEFSDNRTQEKFGVIPEGLEHLPGEVDSSLKSYGTDMFIMGQELLWLAQVLPPAAQGNYTPYNTTGTQTRQMTLQALPAYQLLCQMDQSSCQIMLDVFSKMTPTIENYMYKAARQFGN